MLPMKGPVNNAQSTMRLENIIIRLLNMEIRRKENKETSIAFPAL